MHVDFLTRRFAANRSAPSLVWHDHITTFGDLHDAVHETGDELAAGGVEPGSVVALEADFSPWSVATLLALVELGCVVVPLTAAVRNHRDEFLSVAEVEAVVTERAAHAHVEPTGARAAHPLVAELRSAGHPGLVLFSSGSTGASKAALHDFVPLLEKYHAGGRSATMLAFLLFDHIGGVNTLLHSLASGGCLVTVDDRAPDTVGRAVERWQVEVLPTSPTFLRLLLLSEADRRFDLSTLRLVTYGTEPMPASTLQALAARLPHLRLKQTYGLSEVGILPSKSAANDSLWVRLGGDGYEIRVIDGLLEVRSPSAMLGYLNAPSPFTKDGWMQTGDAVEVDGDYVRILGRRSEMINVGGEKVYPAEVESVIQQMDGVVDVIVSGEPSPLTGQLVRAAVRLAEPEPVDEFRRRMRRFCGERLARFKVPQKVVVVDEDLHSERFKKARSAGFARA